MPEHLPFFDRLKIESYAKTGIDMLFGEVKVDRERCMGCGLCVEACAAAALEVVDKKARMSPDMPACMSCGDCAAICPEGAIELVRFIEFKGAFRYLDRGRPCFPRRF